MAMEGLYTSVHDFLLSQGLNATAAAMLREVPRLRRSPSTSNVSLVQLWHGQSMGQSKSSRRRPPAASPCPCGLTPCAFVIAQPSSANIIIVGSSNSVLDARMGHMIDSFDVVVRCNCAPTRGLERHVGRRTTFRVVNEQSDAYLDDGQVRDASGPSPATIVANRLPWLGEHVQVRRGCKSCFTELAEDVTVCRRNSVATRQHSAFVSYDFHQTVRQQLGVKHPTTGFTAIALFTRLFTRPVTLHGFSFFGSGSWHYWANRTSDVCGSVHTWKMEDSVRRNGNTYHNSTLERRIIQQAERDGIITFLDTSPGRMHKRQPRSAQPLHPGHNVTHQCLEGCLPAPAHGTADGGQCNRSSDGAAAGDTLSSAVRAAASEVSVDTVLPTVELPSCVDPPPCCKRFTPYPRYQLYQRLANGSLARLGEGYCPRGYLSGWEEDDPWWTQRLIRCMGKCSNEPMCRYIAFLPGKTCSRYDVRAGVCPNSGWAQSLLTGRNI